MNLSMKKLSGKLTISKVSGGSDDERVRIEVSDSSSGCQVIEVMMSLEEFAQALFNYAHRPCAFEFNDSGVIGTTQEHKTEVVFIPSSSSRSQQGCCVRESIAPYEVDGWRGCDSDATNPHRTVHCTWANKDSEGSGVYRTVGFTRYVREDGTVV